MVDRLNTTGFGRDGNAHIVAIYTSRTESDQTQSIAYSNDGGRTWTPYEGNPVLDAEDPAFRDPKVFWHGPTGRWIMAVVLADQHRVSLYGSRDLKSWEHLSDFGPEGAHPVRNWECPDLFELPVEGEPGTKKWILQVDSGMGHPWLGSGCQYFVGELDGIRFSNDNPPETALWLDWGRDFYAAQTYAGVPAAGGSRSDGSATGCTPGGSRPPPWRGAQSAPRELRLKRFPEGLRLVQEPVREIESLRQTALRLGDVGIEEANSLIAAAGWAGDTMDLRAELDVGGAKEVGFRVLQGAGGDTLVGFGASPAEVFVDRSRSGEVGFHETFPGRHSARFRASGGRVVLRILVDRSVVEVFAGGGRVAITDRVFPSPSSTGMSLYAVGGSARVVSLVAWKLRSAWR